MNRKEKAAKRQQIDKMYLNICKKYGMDPKKTLKDFESARFNLQAESRDK